MQILDPLSLPLNQSVLIEASAGTGKTYTMANLYLRLILGVGCEPLSVEQILVVTFTKAATQELRDRIRAKLADVANYFADPKSDEAQQAFQDPFLAGLFQAVQQDLHQARLRLKIAEREMDLASIFTIDSFSQKMLFQYAFDSGMRFDIDILSDEKELLKRLSQESWRELFYASDLVESTLVSSHLKAPETALKIARHYLTGLLPELSEQQQRISLDLAQFVQEKALALAKVKQFWQDNGSEISRLILDEINKDYPQKTPKSLNRNSYKKNFVPKYIDEMQQWSESNEQDIPKNWERFTQSVISSKADQGAEPLRSPLFEQAEQLQNHYEQHFRSEHEYSMLIFRFLKHLRQKVADYKQSHKEKSFSDITDFLHSSLIGKNGEQFAKAIRSQFHFAMIDEFQDTNQRQYEIFQRIFMHGVADQGFIMIGDPKQSIYKFRNADIFSYLNAAEHVSLRVTMDKNWRSVPQIVEDTNRLFTFQSQDKSPFIYQGISFQAVQANESDEQLIGAENSYCYILQNYDMDQAAQQAAYQIQQQLKQAEQSTLFLQKNGEKRPLASKDIAILVRGKKQAYVMKSALAQRNIRSIYLSARDSVYESKEAEDLLHILEACQNPYHQRSLLAALGSALWGLDSCTLYQTKQNESRWDKYVSDFIHYQKIWHSQGILPMLHKIFIEQDIIQRLNQQADAERRVTDILHLAELLQEAMLEVKTETALLQWYRDQLADPNGQSDEQKLRLESEQELIKIITIHGSKGLEYPIVWLPFIGLPSSVFRENGYSGKQTPTTYHNEENRLCWGFSPLSDQEKNLINQENFAEDLRLLYVAVTRAKHQLNLILPEQFDEQWSAMSYLLSQGEIGLGGTMPSKSTQSYLAEKLFSGKVILLSETIPQDGWQITEQNENELKPRIFQGKLHTAGQITSFSALYAQHEYLQNMAQSSLLANFEQAQDYDNNTAVISYQNEEDHANFSPYHFPHGTRVGNILHKFFEEWDFSQPITSDQIQEKICQPLDLNEEWLAPLQQWLQNVIHTPFGEHAVCLQQFEQARRLNEWQFYLRLRNEDALPRLNQLLKAETALARHLPDLQLAQLEGFVRGFIDMIVEHNGKYYLIDYKSNLLGNLPQDYLSDNLTKTMGQYRYDLQYLLYTLALHRYLSSRLGDKYHYEQDFGGVAYLFLRGMTGEANSGVFFDKPSLALIEEMDKLFG